MAARPRYSRRALQGVSALRGLGLLSDRSIPCRHVKRYKQRKRFFSPEEAKRLGKVLRESEPDVPSAVAAFRLLLTGFRLPKNPVLPVYVCFAGVGLGRELHDDWETAGPHQGSDNRLASVPSAGFDAGRRSADHWKWLLFNPGQWPPQSAVLSLQVQPWKSRRIHTCDTTPCADA